MLGLQKQPKKLLLLKLPDKICLNDTYSSYHYRSIFFMGYGTE